MEFLRAVTDVVSIPVVASGGAGSLEHLRDAIALGNAHAVLAASIFHFSVYSVREAKEFMASAGIPMRLDPYD